MKIKSFSDSCKTILALAVALFLALTAGFAFAAEKYPAFTLPSKFEIDDSMIRRPPDRAESVEIIRGPNIGEPPKNDAFPDEIDGEVTIYLGDAITTDHIMPAGNRLKFRSNIPKYAQFVFERQDPGFYSKALANKQKGVHTIIVAGESYGQGSSREHAAICPMYLGVKMVVAKSFERIHAANLVNFGILPAVFRHAEDYMKIKACDRLVVDDIRGAVEKGSVLTVRAIASNTTFPVTIDLTQRQRKMLLAGGLINYIKSAR